MIDISVIIPFKNSIETLSRLFDSIPENDNIQIILVENCDVPHTKEELGIKRDFELLNAPSFKYAGGARNQGMLYARGKWIIFADSDDFFDNIAFDIINEYIESKFDLIYFGCNSVFDDTLLPSDRHLMYQGIVDKYINGEIDEMKARLFHVVPWAKMIKRSLIEDNNIQFDEVIAANDMFFSTQVAFYSKNFHADKRSIYVVTTRKGSLANSWNYNILKSRYEVGLRRNLFLKKHGLSKYQVSIMIYLQKAFKMNFVTFCEFIVMGIKYRQNIFVGICNWFKTKKRIDSSDKKNREYIVRE